MKITVHITFFYVTERIKYLQKILQEINQYEYKTDIYIHTNTYFLNDILGKYTNKFSSPTIFFYCPEPLT